MNLLTRHWGWVAGLLVLGNAGGNWVGAQAPLNSNPAMNTVPMRSMPSSGPTLGPNFGQSTTYDSGIGEPPHEDPGHQEMHGLPLEMPQSNSWQSNSSQDNSGQSNSWPTTEGIPSDAPYYSPNSAPISGPIGHAGCGCGQGISSPMGSPMMGPPAYGPSYGGMFSSGMAFGGMGGNGYAGSAGYAGYNNFGGMNGGGGGLHQRYPYYSYRAPWYYQGPPSQNVTIAW